MLTEICQYLKNWFVRCKYYGKFSIYGGALTYADGTVLPFLDGQYYRILGSVMNDDVHQYGELSDVLKDEEFEGAVWSMAVPPAFLELVDEISEWIEANDSAINSPFSSESISPGSYSYTLKSGTGTTGGGSGGVTWQNQFSARLDRWRKI